MKKRRKKNLFPINIVTVIIALFNLFIAYPATDDTANAAIINHAHAQAQQAKQEILCPSNVTLSLTRIPESIVLDTLTVSDKSQQSFDASLANNTIIPTDHIITVKDSRSGGVEGCPLVGKGFMIQAAITNILSNGKSEIPSEGIRIITSNEGLSTIDGEEASYTAPSRPGNLHDVMASVLYDDPSRTNAIRYDQFKISAPYKFMSLEGGDAQLPDGGAGIELKNTLNKTISLLSTHTSHSDSISTGIAIMANIPADLSAGIYTGTITYTLMAQD